MKAAKNMVVALTYELEVEGKIVDKAEEWKPLDYIHGTGMLIPRFEEEVEGKEPGETFEFTLSPEEGYGAYEPKHKFDIPKTAFEVDGKIREDLLQVGRTIPMLNAQGGVVQGTIAAIKEDSVTMDFNHPMAGKSLHFKGKVESVREATQKELEEGLHGEFLPPEAHGCGGHCGGHCGGGCGGDHKDGECCGKHEGGGCCGGNCKEN